MTPRCVAEPPAPKSMGHEVTFAKDTAEPEFLQATLLDLADKVASDLRRRRLRRPHAGPQAARLALSHHEQAAHPAAATNATQVIYEAALALLADLHEPDHLLRLVGLTASGLSEARQTALDDCGRDHACDEAVDLVRSRFGSQALRRANAGLALGQDRSRSAREQEQTDDEPSGQMRRLAGETAGTGDGEVVRTWRRWRSSLGCLTSR